MSGNDIISQGEGVVKQALKMGAASAEAFIQEYEGFSVSIENNAISFVSGGAEGGIGIRVVKDGRIGSSYCTSIEQAEGAIQRALDISSIGEKIKCGFVPGGSFADLALSNSVLKGLGPEELRETAYSLIAGVEEVSKDLVVTGGGAGVGVETIAIVNSEGLAGAGEITRTSAGASCLLPGDPPSTGSDSLVSLRPGIDAVAVGRTAAEKALLSKDPEEWGKPAGINQFEVVLERSALAGMMEFINVPALYGEAGLKGESIYSDRVGTMVAADIVSIFDDPLDEGGLNSFPFDDEGSPSARTSLIEKGELKGFLFDTGSAADLDQETTGNALRSPKWSTRRSYKAVPGVKGRNISIAPGMSYEKMIGEIKRGVIIEDVMGAHTSNPASGDFSVNVSSAFLIENGQVVAGLKPMMFTGNMGTILEGATGIGDDLKWMSGHLSPVAFHFPSIRFGELNLVP